MGYDGIRLAYFIIRTICLSFRRIPTTFKINIIMGPNLINYARGGIPGRLIDGTPQCNSSLESKQEDLQDVMMRRDFQ